MKVVGKHYGILNICQGPYRSHTLCMLRQGGGDIRLVYPLTHTKTVTSTAAQFRRSSLLAFSRPCFPLNIFWANTQAWWKASVAEDDTFNEDMRSVSG